MARIKNSFITSGGDAAMSAPEAVVANWYPPAQDSFVSARFKRILVPVVFSAADKRAVHVACSCACEEGSALDLLHIVEPPSFLSGMHSVVMALSDEQVAEDCAVELSQLAEEGIAAGIPTTPWIRIGNPVKLILQTANQLQSDLIILTMAKTGRWPRRCSDTASRVSRQARCPVLLLPGC